MPLGDRDPIDMVAHSPRCARYLMNYVSEMLEEEGPRIEMMKALDSGAEKPYVDPILRKDIMKLAVRLAMARMLQGTSVKKSEVGLFTVVKKAVLKSDGKLDIDLRLVFDERVPNKLWSRPPWVALAGPEPLQRWTPRPSARTAEIYA